METLDHEQDTNKTDDIHNELNDIIEKLSEIQEVFDQTVRLKFFEKKFKAEWFIFKFYHSLLFGFKNLFDSKNDKFFSKLLETIREVSECDACSLWRINGSNDPKDDRREPSVSLIARILKPGLKDKHGNNANDHLKEEKNFVHKMEPSFTQTILTEHKIDPTRYYFLCSGSEIQDSHHTCREFIEECEIQHTVAIPVLSDDKIIAILHLYFKDKPDNGLLDDELLQNNSLLDKESLQNKENGLLDEFSKFVSKCIYYCNRLILLQKKHTLLNELMREYQKVGKTNLKELFERFIKEGGIFQRYFKYSHASFFVWDDLNNYYQLCSTTGLFWNDGTPVDDGEYHQIFYNTADGLTGNCANPQANPHGKIVIYDDYPGYKEKHPIFKHDRPCEMEDGQNLMLVPISSPTAKKDVIGILRFVEKKHSNVSYIVNYFNDADIELMEYVRPYLALIIQGYLEAIWKLRPVKQRLFVICRDYSRSSQVRFQLLRSKTT